MELQACGLVAETELRARDSGRQLHVPLCLDIMIPGIGIVKALGDLVEVGIHGRWVDHASDDIFILGCR